MCALHHLHAGESVSVHTPRGSFGTRHPPACRAPTRGCVCWAGYGTDADQQTWVQLYRSLRQDLPPDADAASAASALFFAAAVRETVEKKMDELTEQIGGVNDRLDRLASIDETLKQRL